MHGTKQNARRVPGRSICVLTDVIIQPSHFSLHKTHQAGLRVHFYLHFWLFMACMIVYETARHMRGPGRMYTHGQKLLWSLAVTTLARRWIALHICVQKLLDALAALYPS